MPFGALLVAGWMESTPALLQWLANIRPPAFLLLSRATWYLLGSVALLFFRFPQAHAYPAMLSVALKVLPITSTYMALQPPSSRRAANSSSSRSSFDALRYTAARNNFLFGVGLLNPMSDAALHATMSAEARDLRTQLLVGPGTESALLRLTAACRSLHSQHTVKQKQQQQGNYSSADMDTAGASSRSNKARRGSSCATFAQEQAAILLLPPDHEPMVVQFGECSVAAIEAFMKTECSGVDFPIASQLASCLNCLREPAEVCWQQRQSAASNQMFYDPESTPAALHASIEPFCLGSVAGLQLLLETIGLLVAEGTHTGTGLVEAFGLLSDSVTGVTEAERRVFLTARGGLLVQVLRLGLQVDWGWELQQPEEKGRGSLAVSVLRVMGMLVAEDSGVSCYGEMTH